MGMQLEPEKACWQNAALTFHTTGPRLPPLSLADLAAHMYAHKQPVGTLVHAYYQAEWATAVFDVAGKATRLAITAWACQSGLPLLQQLFRQ